MHTLRSILAAAMLLAAASPAYADATFFIGTNSSPSNRQLRGFSFGTGSMIGWEFEYANSVEERAEAAPGLRTFIGDVLLQTPFSIAGFQPYVIGGIGMYRERLDAHQETSLAFDTGAGVKMTLFGPVRIRVDYRVLKLQGDALEGTAHRVYSGVNVRF